MLGYEESADDSIVPSTPTLYVPRRADGFSEAVSSPHPQIQPVARFTFAESRVNLASEGIDDTRVDLTQLDESGVPSTPTTHTSSSNETSSTSAATSIVQNEPIAGTSSRTIEGSAPITVVTEDAEGN